ncbi:hypothetical protein LOTGIDRAFT_228383 [Lottia gigantea]|uniref:Nucleoplasmin core domain-containing protein n=1 Tax=Lottia gigantea TaxID=225164 RepID=V4AWG8_LOTGI|nr:hypothetical protein LOTGIDRAFT_228383 [Lottia gigantea]ESO97836.1 hypothetical protein LOTGIDRAFT_228383 [Lottia gigantea]
MAVETSDMEDTQLGEFFWGCELSKENPSVTFSIKEEDEDSDFMHHTLFVKHAVLGGQAVKDEINIVTVETQNFDKETIKQPFISLTRGESSMCYMDISFTDKSPVTFSLSEGTGPIYISAVQLVEFPEEDADHTMDEEGLTEEEEESPVRPKLKTNKRKGGATVGASKAKQRSKMEADDDEDEDESEEDEEDEDEEDDDEEMEDEEEEPSPEKKKGAKKKNAKAGGKGAAKKVEKPKKKAAAKKSKK